MKIAYLTNQYPKISHTFIRREIRALEAQGVAVTRFALRRAAEDFSDPDDQRELERTEILTAYGASALAQAVARIIRAKPRTFIAALRQTVRMGWRSQRGLARHGAYLAEACLLQERCAAKGITHLHVHHGTNPAAVALLCKMLGGPPYSLTVHGPEEFENAPRHALQVKIAHAVFVIAVSEWGLEQLRQACDPTQHQKIFLVRNGADENYIAPAPVPIPDTPQFLWVGRLAEQKDPLLVLEAMTRLCEIQTDCTITLFGDGPLRAAMEQEITRRALAPNILLKGWANGEQILQELRNVRALVMSSRAENVPSVIMEALLQERPVISTNVGGVCELVQDNETGWLIPPGDAHALADAMRCALETPPAALQQMGKTGRAFILQHFSLEQTTAALERLFRQYAIPASKEG